MRELYERLAGEVGKVVVGQDDVVRGVVTGLAVGGHVLLEGPPGVAKTLLASAVARALGLEFRRVQFTPDMLPSDLTGTSTLRAGELAFRPGPVFANLLLADEINRTPPKTQAALLEAMQEGQVSADGASRPLPDPFLVVATQNPIEYEGTYPLPEAQLDRFLMKIAVGYPDAAGELRMLGLAREGLRPVSLQDVVEVASAGDVRAARHAVDAVSVSDAVATYLVEVVRATRELPSVTLGASPRAAVHLLVAAKAAAALAGRAFVTPDDVAGLAGAVLGHRIVLRPEAELERYDAADAVRTALESVRVPALSPTPRAAAALAAIALLALVVGPLVAALLAAALAGALLADANVARRPPRARRQVPSIVARGVAATLAIELSGETRRVRVRQARGAPEIELSPQEDDGGLASRLVVRRRGRFTLAPAALRVRGPAGLATWDHAAGERQELLVYPDLPAARRLALAVRSGSFREAGERSRGPLGLGTEFESIRDYLPDDDIRQVNWPATVRMGRPMSNQYRVEQDRDVICVLDCGRLMAAPLSGGATRLDLAIDAATAVGLVADELGDRCGTVAFDATVHRRLTPRRRGGDALVRAVFDLQPAPVDSDYELAFATIAGAKRALVIVFTDLIEEVAARSLVAAVPVLARRHEVVVAGVVDPDLDALLRARPRSELDVYRAAAALDVLAARERAAARVRGAGARVLETAPASLGRACVAAYLSAKARARL